MRRFSTSAATSSSQWQMKFFPPSLPTPPYPAPDLIPIKAQLRRTSAPATSHTCYDPKSSNNNRKVSRKNNDRVGEKHSEKANENSLSLLSPELLSNSPPQSVTAESISHSEFDNLFVANVNFSTDNDPSSKIRDDTCKSSSSHYSEESLLTALVKCQSVLRESYEKSLSKHQMQGDSTEIVPNERLINVNDRKCLISCLNDDRSNQDRPKLHFRNNEVTEGNELSDGASNEKSHMIRRRITIAGERPSLVYTQKSTSPRHPQTDKEGNDTACHRHNETQNLGRVAIAKLNWENYFIPKPPRIAKNKITKDDRITRSVTVETKHEVGQFFRSNSVDCAYRVYDSDPNINNEVEITNVEKQYNNSYKDHLKTRRFKCISTPVSPVYSASDSPRTVSPATRSHISQNEIRNDNSMKSKYIGKGYSPSFIRLIYDNELDDQKQQTDESTYATHESCDLDMTNGKTSSSTLTLTENTTTTKDHDIKQNINTTDKQTVLEKKEFVSVENEFNKRLCTSDIQYSNCNAKNISEDCYRIARPLSVTLKRHRIRFPKLKTNGRQTSLSSSDSSEDFDHKYEEEYDNDKDTILEESNCLYMSTENKQTDFPLNKHAHWQRMYVEKDRLFRRMNKTIHENDTQIDHLTSPIDKPLTYVRSHSADYNPTLIHPRIRSQSAGIDRSESFHKVVSHITSGVKLTTHQELLHTRLNSTENDSKFLSSFISPISINTSLSSNIIRNDSAQVFRDDKHSATKKDNCKSRTRLNKEIFLNKQLLPSPSSFCRVPKICTNNVLLCQNKLGKNYDDNSDEHVDVIDDHRVKKVNCKPEIMSLSPAARRYEEHVLAAVSGKGCNKFGNQIFFGDNKNCLTRQNTLKNVKISPDGIYTNKPTDTVNYQNYDEGSDSVDHQKEDAINAEIWREKLGAITRWRREVDSAMLAGETDIKEILCNPEIPFSDSFVENPYCLSNIPFNNEAINYFQTSPVQITSFQPHDPCFASKGLQTQFLPTYGVPLKPFQTCAKPVMGAGEQCRNYLPKNTLPHTYQVRPETTRNTNLFGNIHANDQPYIADTTKNYQQPSHAIPSKVVINPSAAPNNYLHQNINSRLNSSSPVNHQHQQTWLKAPSLNLPSTRQRVNSESVAVLQPVGPTQSHTNMLYSANNNPCNLETKTQMPIPSHESNLVIPNMNSTNASNKNQTIRSFRNFFTPKLRRKTYEMNKTEPAGFKQDLFSTTNKLQSSSGGQSSTNNSRSPTAINLPNQYNQFNKVTPSSSYTDALNLAVAANAALCEAFHQSIRKYQLLQVSIHNLGVKPIRDVIVKLKFLQISLFKLTKNFRSKY
ncbi:unnamed protein product [Heterobilharzia americana]|nr:unnamed protein product [Heterobilharzia americana]